MDFTEVIGLGEAYVKQSSCGKAVLESHMVYEREVSNGDQLKIHCWLLAVDTKRLHFFHEVYNLSKGFRAATSEQVDIHIDLKQRASVALPNDLYIQLQGIVTQHHASHRPSGLARQIRPPKNIWYKHAKSQA